MPCPHGTLHVPPMTCEEHCSLLLSLKCPGTEPGLPLCCGFRIRAPVHSPC